MNLVESARALKGARWRHRGRKPWALDCVGFVLLAARNAGIQVNDTQVRYGREPWDERLRAEVQARLVRVDDWAPGDVALIRYAPRQPLHLAIIGDRPGLSLIHVHSLHGVVEHALDQAQVVEVYRWPA